MRYKLHFDLENEYLQIQYRECILSYIKKSLSEYDSEYFNKIYHEKDNNIKPFTFSIFLNKSIFEKDKIQVSGKAFDIYISFEDINMAIIFYNSFNKQLNKKFSIDKNSWCLRTINLIPEKNITSENITVKFMSPLVVRNRQNNKDYYYSFQHSDFEDMVKINVREQLKISKLPKELAETLSIKPIMPKKTVVKFYEKQMECSIGIFELTGDIQLLDYVYKTGMGSRHSSGFGMFDII